jgi:hypothetical protein
MTQSGDDWARRAKVKPHFKEGKAKMGGKK